MRVVALLLVVAAAAGCAAPITTTQSLAAPEYEYSGLIVQPLTNDVIGEINEKVCGKIMTDAAHGILQKSIVPYMHVPPEVSAGGGDRAKKVRMASLPLDSLEKVAPHIVEVHTRLVSYDKGSATVRFLFGMLAGGGEVVLDIELRDHATGFVVTAGRTKATIQGAFSSEQDVIGPLSKAITKFVKDNMKNLEVAKSVS